MAKGYDSQEYNDLITRAGKMVAGIKKYRSRTNWPPRLDAPARARQAAKLKTARDAFVAAERAMATASKSYHALFVQLERDLSQDDDAVRGNYGKANERVEDFGTKRIKPSPGRKPAAKKKAAAGTTAS